MGEAEPVRYVGKCEACDLSFVCTSHHPILAACTRSVYAIWKCFCGSFGVDLHKELGKSIIKPDVLSDERNRKKDSRFDN